MRQPAGKEVGTFTDLNSFERPLRDYVNDVSEQTDVRVGAPLPLGTYAVGEGVNFALFSRHASRVRLELFDNSEDATVTRSSTWIPRATAPATCGTSRGEGDQVPVKSMPIEWNSAVSDPRKAIVSISTDFSSVPVSGPAISQLPPWDFALARGYNSSAPEQDLIISKLDNSRSSPKCVFVNEPFEWNGDRPPRHPWSKTVIYETHVRGFTIHPKSGVDHPGTYRGLMEKIPYLETLGVTAVELMPVQEFNENSITRRNPQTSQPLRNYWGYNPWPSLHPKLLQQFRRRRSAEAGVQGNGEVQAPGSK